MVVSGRGVSAFAALVCGQVLAAMSPAAASTPDPSWRGVDRLHIVAHLVAPADSPIPSDGFCERVRRVAAEQAPFPVDCVALGEAPAAEAAGALVIVQAAVQPVGGDRLLVVAARRTAAAGLEPSPIYLGATPRAARLSGAAAGEAADAALREALSEILPWLAHGDE